ncbi:uncharacterized protein ASPGLDRAFT_37386 [Aspergillus glaucus CBS 516.65]|uniref:Uncharacterized protein n=1 Tax=Aspergillus glaucus CBS 516.65 TaxID=1160497 RepID=A0A1L9VDV3_ASPGL|nr:hypothetical protein ASPGLDRAFT_37386 [Aspergillus glaucus CBS 516.65]OJJ82075.1 hypothetical protein ASPGLDRAFT_37386 [Aspergillus glaucus CBS 516.65]
MLKDVDSIRSNSVAGTWSGNSDGPGFASCPLTEALVRVRRITRKERLLSSLGLSSKSLTASRHCPDNPHLFYNRTEYDDAVFRLSTDPTLKLSLNREAQDHLFDVNNGNPAAINALFRYLHAVYRSKTLHNQIKEVTKELVVDAISNEQEDTLQYGHVPRDLHNPAIKRCYEDGWIHSETAEGSDEGIICVLPSRIHEKYVEFFLGSTDPKPFPKSLYPTLLEFCEALVRIFSR